MITMPKVQQVVFRSKAAVEKEDDLPSIVVKAKVRAEHPMVRGPPISRSIVAVCERWLSARFGF